MLARNLQSTSSRQEIRLVDYTEVCKVQKLITLKEAAALLSVSPEFLKKLQREGRLKVVRLGTAVRIEERELERLCREEFAQ